MLLMKKLVNQEIVAYIEQNIYPVYDTFDKGHNSNHAKDVVSRSLKYYEFLNDDSIQIDMVFVIAAYHDIGNKIERKNHAYHSGQILLADTNLTKWFTAEQIQMMAQACEDHSTSSENPPRTIYGKIVSDADKDNDIVIGLQRGWEFAKKHLPHMTEEEKVEDLHRELKKRFDDNGTVVFYISSKDNQKFLQEMKKFSKDKAYFKESFYKIAKKENWI